MALVRFLTQRKRKSEVIVLAPDWPSNGWYTLLEMLCDAKQRWPAGKLQAVASDAPPRCNSWPIICFHIPAVGRKSPGEQRAWAVGVIQNRARRYLHLDHPLAASTPASPPRAAVRSPEQHQVQSASSSAAGRDDGDEAHKKPTDHSVRVREKGAQLQHLLSLYTEERPLKIKAMDESPYRRPARSPSRPNKQRTAKSR